MAQRRNSRRHQALITVLIAARIKAGKSQRDISDELQQAHNFAHLVESGERMLTALELPDYAIAVNLTPGRLIGRMLKLESSGEPIPPRGDFRKRRTGKKLASDIS